MKRENLFISEEVVITNKKRFFRKKMVTNRKNLFIILIAAIAMMVGIGMLIMGSGLYSFESSLGTVHTTVVLLWLIAGGLLELAGIVSIALLIYRSRPLPQVK